MFSMFNSSLLRVTFVVAIAGLLAVGTVFLVTRIISTNKKQSAADSISALKCPEAYNNNDERTQAYLDFTNDYFTEYPSKHGNYDFISGRIDFLISHTCTLSLIKFGYDGTRPIDTKVRADLINNALHMN